MHPTPRAAPPPRTAPRYRTVPLLPPPPRLTRRTPNSARPESSVSPIGPAIAASSASKTSARYGRPKLRPSGDLIRSLDAILQRQAGGVDVTAEFSRIAEHTRDLSSRENEELLEALERLSKVQGDDATLVTKLSVGALETLLQAAGRQRAERSAERLFAELRKRGGDTLVSADAWAARMQACATVTEAVALYETMLKTGHALHTAPLSTLVALLAQQGHHEALILRLRDSLAQKVPIRMPVLGMACVALVKASRPSHALAFFTQMAPSSSAIHGSASGNAQMAGTAARVVQALARGRYTTEALTLAQSHCVCVSTQPSVAADVLHSLGHLKAPPALAYRASLHASLSQNELVSAALLCVYARHLMANEARALQAHMEAQSVTCDANTWLALVRLYGEVGHVPDLLHAFQRHTSLTHPRSLAYETCLTALLRARAPHETLWTLVQQASDAGHTLPPTLLAKLPPKKVI